MSDSDQNHSEPDPSVGALHSLDGTEVFSSPPWKAATESERCDVVLHKVMVTRPGGVTFDSGGVMYWSAGEGPVIEILDPEGLGEGRQLGGTPGELSPPESHWKLNAVAIAPTRPSTSLQFRLEAQNLTAEADRVRRDHPPVDPPRNPAVVRFRPWFVTLTAGAKNVAWSPVTHGLVSSRGVVHYSLSRPRVEQRGVSVVTTGAPFSDFRLFDTTRVRIRPCNGNLFVALDWPNDRGLDRKQAWIDFTFALGVATGAQCQWLSTAEQAGASSRVTFFTPMEPWRLLPSRHGILPEEFGMQPAEFETLIGTLYQACRADPRLGLVIQGAHAMIWDSGGSTTQVRGLAVSAAVEALSREMDRKLLPKPVVARHEPAILELVESNESVVAHPGFKRLKGLIQSSWGQRSPSDVLRELAAGVRPLLTSNEVQAWKRLRNLLAHGRFHPDEHDGPARLYRTTFLSQNIVNKMTLALAGYEGCFRDYSQTNWPVVEFSWRVPPAGTCPAASGVAP